MCKNISHLVKKTSAHAQESICLNKLHVVKMSNEIELRKRQTLAAEAVINEIMQKKTLIFDSNNKAQLHLREENNFPKQLLVTFSTIDTIIAAQQHSY